MTQTATTTTTTNNNTSVVPTTTNTTTTTSNFSIQKNGTSTNVQSTRDKSGKRIELEKLIREFQSKLGKDWEKYHETLSLFLIGKLSRPELIDIINPILKPENLFKYHNKLLMLNFANSLKNSSSLNFSNELASFWNKKLSKTSKNVKSSQYEKFKSNIMGLPIKERRRIKNITRDSGKRNKLNAGITLTRHTLLPKIPMIQDKEQQQLQVNNLVQWQQDVLNGINAPISTESYEIPDADNPSKLMLMTMREHGLTGGLNSGVMEVLLLGLKSHLKNIVESAIDVAKYRKNKYTNNDYVPYDKPPTQDLETSPSKKRKYEEVENSKDIILSVEDLNDTFEMFPYLIEPNGPRLRLSNVLLENDDYKGKDFNYTLPPKPISYITKKPIDTSVPNNSNNNTNSNENNNNDSNKKSDQSNNSSASSPTQVQQQQPLPRPDAHIGTNDELKWVLHDLISTM